VRTSGGMEREDLPENSPVKKTLDNAPIVMLSVNLTQAGYVQPTATALFVQLALTVKKEHDRRSQPLTIGIPCQKRHTESAGRRN